mmetsp:Transcript_43135/g.104401  ORF Transcript_43135/g.104401 Transcript_43135/m.104401 type:complete len:456 (-) Transcript_43135:255-1622(-)
MKFSKTTVGVALATTTAATTATATSSFVYSSDSSSSPDQDLDSSMMHEGQQRLLGGGPRHRRLKKKLHHSRMMMKKKKGSSLLLVNTNEEDETTTSNVESSSSSHHHQTNTGGAADLFTGILHTGGMATYGSDSYDGGGGSGRGAGDVRNQRRWLQQVDFSTPVKNTNLTLGDFDPVDDLDYLSDEYLEDRCTYCECTNTTESLTTVCRTEDYCVDYNSRCGQPSTECFDDESVLVIEDNSNFVYSGCVNYTVPYDLSICFEGVIEDAVATSCSTSFNGVECQSCTIEPMVFPENLMDGGPVAFCYVADCTNTDVGIMVNDCYWSNYSPIYNNVHQSAGCVDSCDICPGVTGGIGNPEAVVDVDAYAAITFEVDTCVGLIDLGLSGYFTEGECTDLQSVLPDPCGCTVPAEPTTTEPTTMEPTTMAPSAATPNHVMNSLFVGGGAIMMMFGTMMN